MSELYGNYGYVNSSDVCSSQNNAKISIGSAGSFGTATHGTLAGLASLGISEEAYVYETLRKMSLRKLAREEGNKEKDKIDLTTVKEFLEIFENSWVEKAYYYVNRWKANISNLGVLSEFLFIEKMVKKEIGKSKGVVLNDGKKVDENFSFEKLKNFVDMFDTKDTQNQENRKEVIEILNSLHALRTKSLESIKKDLKTIKEREEKIWLRIGIHMNTIHKDLAIGLTLKYLNKFDKKSYLITEKVNFTEEDWLTSTEDLFVSDKPIEEYDFFVYVFAYLIAKFNILESDFK